MTEQTPEEFAKSRLSASDWKTFDDLCKARDKKRARDAELEEQRYREKSDPVGENNVPGDRRRARDVEQQTLEGGQRGNALDERRFNNMTSSYDIARSVRARIVDEMRDLRQAERDVAQHCGMAFDGDSAEEVYRSALEHHFGVPRSKTAGLSASHLRVVLKNLPVPGSPRFGQRSAAMAFDGASDGKLDSILRGAPELTDLSTRNDVRW
jgi:hypothetical protein